MDQVEFQCHFVQWEFNNVYFSIVSVTDKLWFFFTHFLPAIRFCILSLSFTIYFETILFYSSQLGRFHSNIWQGQICWVCRMGFISDLKFIRLFSNLIGSRSLIDKHRHTSGIGRVVTSRKIVIFISIYIYARACQLPVYSGCNFTSGKILCIRLTHPLLLYRIFNP